MEFSTYLWTTLAAFLTLCTFSFLYKDNPFYRFAEHLVVGVSAGYFVIILWHNSLVPNLFQRLADGTPWLLWIDSSHPWYLIPALLGFMMFSRFSRDYTWVSRWPMALYIGISAGLAVPLEMSNRVNKQLYAAMSNFNWSYFGGSGFLDTMSGYSQLIIFVGAIAALIYFFFSKAHTGAFGGIAKFGLWILMIGFGASFGFTVMARISLFINRIQFLDKSWIQTAFNAENAHYNGGFKIVFALVVLIVLAYIVLELLKHLRRQSAQS